jgi:hypothetical protein
MGNEALVDYVEGRSRARVKAHLDGQFLQLSGEKKLKLPLNVITKAIAEKGALKVETAGASFSLMLGDKVAELWAKKILNPPSLASKLGIKADTPVALVGKLPAEIAEAGAASAAVKQHARMPAALSATMAVVALPPAREEATLRAAAKLLKPGGALWLVYEKGTPFNGDMIIACARKAGLKDTKVTRVSETHTALRFIQGAKA